MQTRECWRRLATAAWKASAEWSQDRELQQAWARVAVGFERLADQRDQPCQCPDPMKSD